MRSKKHYNTLEIVLKEFTKEQEDHPSKPVTKKQVYARIKKAFNKETKLLKEPLFSYRTMERAFDKLIIKERITREDDGKYWIPQYLENDREHLREQNEYKDLVIKNKENKSKWQKRIIEQLKKENAELVRIVKPYLDALLYCDSEEDWALLEAFFAKMRENKYEIWEKEHREAGEMERERQAEILEEMKGET